MQSLARGGRAAAGPGSRAASAPRHALPRHPRRRRAAGAAAAQQGGGLGAAAAAAALETAARLLPVDELRDATNDPLLQQQAPPSRRGASSSSSSQQQQQPQPVLRDVRAVSYVSRRRMDDAAFDPDAVDDEGLPIVYNEARIADFWRTRPAELAQRWAKFFGIAAPWLASLAQAAVQGRLSDPARQAQLARDAVRNVERLGPTFVKLAQVLSIRPDVLPPAVLKELSRLQDGVKPFSTAEARRVLERELGRPLGDVFSSFGPEPVAAASLAQVYKAVRRDTGEEVAVKVQRPGALSTISKDLFVLRRAAGTYEKLVKRFTAQETDYQTLVSTFAEGLYFELDFTNEALNAERARELMRGCSSEAARTRVLIPRPHVDLTTRRVLVQEWVDGEKLSDLAPEEVRRLVGVGQESFLVQLLEVGFIVSPRFFGLCAQREDVFAGGGGRYTEKGGKNAIAHPRSPNPPPPPPPPPKKNTHTPTPPPPTPPQHGDPHPGNLLRVRGAFPGDPRDGMLCILDWGLTATIDSADERAAMVSAVIHLSNRDWNALVGDFESLGFLPVDCDRGQVVPVMARVLGPYLRGGGAKSLDFSSLSADLLSATLEIPFSIPPYMSLLARSVATLEGIALVGDPDYKMVAQAYPFVARRVLLTAGGGAGSAAADGQTNALLTAMLLDDSGRVRPQRLGAVVQAALGYVADGSGAGGGARAQGFVDLDAVPEEGAPPREVARFLLSPAARSLRPLMVSWLASALDLLGRDSVRRAAPGVGANPPPTLRLPRPPLLPFLPQLPALPLPPPPPVFLPGLGLVPFAEAVDRLCPPLTQDEEVYAQTLVELGAGLLGVAPADLRLSATPQSLQAALAAVANPSEPLRELQGALQEVSGDAEASGAAREIAGEVVDRVAKGLAERAGVDVDTLFPFRRALMASAGGAAAGGGGGAAVPSLSGDGGGGGDAMATLEEWSERASAAEQQQQQQWRAEQQQQQQQQQQQKQQPVAVAVAEADVVVVGASRAPVAMRML